jgi:hypothetical protein
VPGYQEVRDQIESHVNNRTSGRFKRALRFGTSTDGKTGVQWAGAFVTSKLPGGAKSSVQGGVGAGVGKGLGAGAVAAFGVAGAATLPATALAAALVFVAKMGTGAVLDSVDWGKQTNTLLNLSRNGTGFDMKAREEIRKDLIEERKLYATLERNMEKLAVAAAEADTARTELARSYQAIGETWEKRVERADEAVRTMFELTHYHQKVTRLIEACTKQMEEVAKQVKDSEATIKKAFEIIDKDAEYVHDMASQVRT